MDGGHDDGEDGSKAKDMFVSGSWLAVSWQGISQMGARSSLP